MQVLQGGGGGYLIKLSSSVLQIDQLAIATVISQKPIKAATATSAQQLTGADPVPESLLQFCQLRHHCLVLFLIHGGLLLACIYFLPCLPVLPLLPPHGIATDAVERI